MKNTQVTAVRPQVISLGLMTVFTFGIQQNAAYGQEATPEAPALRTTLPVPIEAEPDAAKLDWAKGQSWQKATMFLSGSMCPACLIKLEHDLREMPGIAYAKIARDANATAKDKPKTACAQVIYDLNAIKFDRLLNWIKREKYKATEVQQSTIQRAQTP